VQDYIFILLYLSHYFVPCGLATYYRNSLRLYPPAITLTHVGELFLWRSLLSCDLQVQKQRKRGA
jgi:hypothetical protein